ncbi:RsmB/NOP family class I SAM-dependent RNA methyltransferase [Candidatus Micrarchaeota archaeon]|nr:RsmB/NOP family class I SAM-dependent RNA methyltransferase [Candidatus Micrarchaeota archaeon]MBU1166642.1 RsmB/NOP family class I SAM-dependent RNA methyltransferase [Candidatus Micrarchaeota archaeon]MBU1886599.1 RsmB/NOP family class I SAM-dependent RNA methyltransferase [Candidatus Micrarchaeota archaeon]
MAFLIPEQFKERYSRIVDEPEKFFEIMDEHLPKSFRVNTIKSSVTEVISRFDDYGIGTKSVPWYSDAFISENPDIGATLEHFHGGIYLQELVSMLPPLLVRKELQKATYVLDACAAPGSKTTQLAALMENKNTIIANDLSYSRIRALRFNLEKTGVLNTAITNYDLRHFPNLQFDIVLLDAPCSAEGTVRKNNELSKIWSFKQINTHSNIQKQLIVKAFQLLRPGGSMIYSTCTFAPEENECVVNHLFDKFEDAKLEKITIDGLKISNGITSWNGTDFDPEIEKTVRIWPHHNNTGGFFLAKVTK